MTHAIIDSVRSDDRDRSAGRAQANRRRAAELMPAAAMPGQSAAGLRRRPGARRRPELGRTSRGRQRKPRRARSDRGQLDAGAGTRRSEKARCSRRLADTAARAEDPRPAIPRRTDRLRHQRDRLDMPRSAASDHRLIERPSSARTIQRRSQCRSRSSRDDRNSPTPTHPTTPDRASTGLRRRGLEHLSDLEHVRERPSMYIGDTGPAACTTWSTKSSTTRSTRRWPATPRTISRHDQQRRLGDGRRRRPRHPRRAARSFRRDGPRVHPRRRDDRAQVRRQVRQGGLPDLRRLARRRRHGRELPLRMVRGRSPPRRARLPAGIRARRARRRRCAASAPPTKLGTKTTFKPDPRSFTTTKFIVQHALQAAAGAGVPQPRRARSIFKDERTGEGESFHYERGIIEFVEHLNRASEPSTPT